MCEVVASSLGHVIWTAMQQEYTFTMRVLFFYGVRPCTGVVLRSHTGRLSDNIVLLLLTCEGNSSYELSVGDPHSMIELR